jgi:DAACS family dicarboxylate/amino acid:cation (Na+ or H+) symporter
MAESIGNSGKGMKLHTKILLAFLIGAVIGSRRTDVRRRARGGGMGQQILAGPVGQIFLRMLFMIVIPLVFASISLGRWPGDLRRVGRVGTKAIVYFRPRRWRRHSA